MTMEIALRERLKADPVIIAAKASVEWARRERYPEIVLTVASEPRNRFMTGRQGFIPVRIYFDVMATDAPTKVVLREAVLAVLGFGDKRSGIRFWPARDINVTDLGEQTDTQFIHRDQISAVVPYRVEA